MPSQALHTWQTLSRRALDELEAVRASAGRRARGRRFTTQQISQAYVILLSARFQLFCRDLHTEAVDFLTNQLAYAPVNGLLRASLTDGRKLDTGNPNPGNLGADFGRLSMKFWDAVRDHDRRNAGRQIRLEELVRWRNAIAHQDFGKPGLRGRSEVRRAEIRLWRAACDELAVSFDRAVGIFLKQLMGTAPW